MMVTSSPQLSPAPFGQLGSSLGLAFRGSIGDSLTASLVRTHSLRSCRFPVGLRLLREWNTDFLSQSVILLARVRGVLSIGKAAEQECVQEERAVRVCGARHGFKEA